LTTWASTDEVEAALLAKLNAEDEPTAFSAVRARALKDLEAKDAVPKLTGSEKE